MVSEIELKDAESISAAEDEEKTYAQKIREFVIGEKSSAEEKACYMQGTSEFFRKTGIGFSMDQNEYIIINPNKLGENMSVIKKEVALMLGRRALKRGEICEGMYSNLSNTDEKLKYFDADESKLTFIRENFSPFEPAIKAEVGNMDILVMNAFKATNIMSEATALRASKEKEGKLYKDFSWLQKHPRVLTVLRNLCVTDERIEFFVNWLSFCASTRKKSRATFFFKGVPGTGKTFFFDEIISYFFGQQSSFSLDTDAVADRFCPECFDRALFCCFNEIKMSKTEGNKSYERLKIWITDDKFLYNQKNMKARTVRNWFNCIFYSNHAVPIQIQSGDRRYTVFTTNTIELKDVVFTEWGEDMDTFAAGLRATRDAFFLDLCCYDFNAQLANQCMNTREKIVIQEASDTKKNQLAFSLQKLNPGFFESLGEKIGDMIDGKVDNKIYWEEAFSNVGLDIEKKYSPADIEQAVRAFFIRLQHTIKNNGGYAPSRDIIFVTQLVLTSEADMIGNRAMIGSQTTSEMLKHYFTIDKKRIYLYNLNLTPKSNQKEQTRVYTCQDWQNYAKAEKILDEEEFAQDATEAGF